MADDKAAGPPGVAGSRGIPSWAQPQLATLTKDRFSDPQWLFERKLDGERLIAFRDGQTSFSMLQQRLGVAHPAPGLIEDFPVTYYIFDVLFADGHDIRGLP